MCIDQSSEQFEISVIVPHLNQRKALIKCLTSLDNQSFDGMRYEVIVVDNGSTLGITDIQSKFPRFRFITEEKKGAAHARNAGIAASCAKNIAFVDADCVASRDWLRSGFAALTYNPLVGGKIEVTSVFDDRPTPTEAFERIFAFQQEFYINRKRFSVTANLFARRSVVAKIGEFKSDVAEDVDWCIRARRIGIPLVFSANSIVKHPARRNWRELTNKWDRLIWERWNGLKGRYPFQRFIWSGMAVVTALSTLPHMARVVFSNRIHGFANKAAAVGVLIRIRFWRFWRMLMMLRQPHTLL